MTIVNRRNAVLGWAVWNVAKRVAKRKAKSAAPSVEGGRPNASLVAVVLVGAAGAASAATFWRKHRADELEAA
jgi:hypothetical protein